MKAAFSIITTSIILLNSLFTTSAFAADIILDNPLVDCKQTPNISVLENYPGPDKVGKTNNLRQLTGSGFVAGGINISIKGVVFDTRCQIISDALVEIWQADSNGIYGKEADKYFAGSGKTYTDNLGEYNFLTIFPGAEDKTKAPYINVRVSHPSFKTINTILFFPKHPKNANDEKYSKIISKGYSEPEATLSGENNFYFNIMLPGKTVYREF